MTKPKKTLSDYCRRIGDDRLIREWDYEKNAPLTPEDVAPQSNKKAWWKCGKGHNWEAMIRNRVVKSAGCPYCSGYYAIPGETDLKTLRPDLAKEWDYEKNGALTPDMVTIATGRKVWWKCDKGHSWQAAPHSRTTQKSGCPYCSGRVAVPGETDLQTRFPEIAAEWHPTNNGKLTPRDVTGVSGKKVWWLCPEGHTYQMAVSDRTSLNEGCPYCSGHKVLEGFNDLATLRPDIAAQWHPTKNGDLKPTMVTVNSGKKVWWICDKGHEYPATIAKRTDKKDPRGCPYCANRKLLKGFNDLATVYPTIARQWHPTLNGDLTPDQVLPGAGKKIWWQCSEGHVWQAYLYNRTGPKKNGCPICAGKVKQRKKHD